MKNPNKVTPRTPQESRAKGWAAESRDDDGRLCTLHTQFETDCKMLKYICEERTRGKTVTIFPKP